MIETVIRGKEEIAKIANSIHEGPLNIVTVGGCFDILHAGHVQLFNQAQAHGDILWVLTNSDESMGRVKAGRPIIPLEDRLQLLDALCVIDYISPFYEDTPCELLKIIKPKVHIKGADWAGKRIPEDDLVPEYIKQIEFLPLLEGRSTSGIIDRIRNA